MKRILILGLGVAGMLAAGATSALAAARDDVLNGISRCGGIADDRTWLDCVYGAAQPMRAQLGLQPAPATQQRLVPPGFPGVSAPAAQNFAPPAQNFAAPAPAQAMAAPAPRPGFFARMITPKHEAAEPPTRLASYKFDASGHFSVTLANGESWDQDSGDSAMARWNKPAATYTAQIEPSSSDYHLLKVGSQQFMVRKN